MYPASLWRLCGRIEHSRSCGRRDVSVSSQPCARAGTRPRLFPCRSAPAPGNRGSAELVPKRLVEIENQILGCFDADRESHDIRPGAAARRCSSLNWRWVVLGGMKDETARIADIGEMGKTVLRAQPTFNTRLIAALDAEGEHRARALWGDICRASRETGSISSQHRRPRRPSHGRRGIPRPWGIGDVALHPQGQCFDAGQGQKRSWARAPAEIAQGDRARLGGEAESPKVSGKLAHGKRARVRSSTETCRIGPSRIFQFDHHAAERIAVAGEKLGRRMGDDVGAPGDGLAELGRRQRIVDDQRNVRPHARRWRPPPGRPPRRRDWPGSRRK